MCTRGFVGGLPNLANARRTAIRSQAQPAELMLAAARHVVTPFILFDAIPTIGTRFEFGGILQKLPQSNFLTRASVAIVLLARSTFMPRAVMRKTSLGVTLVATQDGPSTLVHMKLAGSTSFLGAPAKLGIFLHQAVAYIFVVGLERFLVGIFLYLSCIQQGRTWFRSTETRNAVMVLFPERLSDMSL